MNESKIVDVNIERLDISLIQNQISSYTLRQKLAVILNMLLYVPEKYFNFYINGSLNKNNLDKKGCIIMGSGWVIQHHDISFTCGVKFHLSSTCPELVAILTAILATPACNSLNVFTDN